MPSKRPISGAGSVSTKAWELQSFAWAMKVSQDGPVVPESPGRSCLASTRRTTSLSISAPKARVICWAMCTQPKCGLRRFSAMMAAMRSADGPFGPGLRRGEGEEAKILRYFLCTRASWNLNSVAVLTSAPSFGSRFGRTNNVAKPRTKRSTAVRLGARCRQRLLMSNWCLSNSDSAATARTPAGRRSFARVTSRWMARMRLHAPGEPYHDRRCVQGCTARADCVTLRIRHSHH